MKRILGVILGILMFICAIPNLLFLKDSPRNLLLEEESKHHREAFKILNKMLKESYENYCAEIEKENQKKLENPEDKNIQKILNNSKEEAEQILENHSTIEESIKLNIEDGMFGKFECSGIF